MPFSWIEELSKAKNIISLGIDIRIMTKNLWVIFVCRLWISDWQVFLRNNGQNFVHSLEEYKQIRGTWPYQITLVIQPVWLCARRWDSTENPETDPHISANRVKELAWISFLPSFFNYMVWNNWLSTYRNISLESWLTSCTRFLPGG